MNDTTYIERKGYKLNDLYFTAKNKKGLQGRKLSRQAYFYALKPTKKGQNPPIWVTKKP